jgi:hypothetical protein
MTRRGVAALAVLALAAPVAADQAASKPKKPRLEMRFTPRMGLSPVTVHFTVELVGGDDQEQWYCPEIEWDWDDGGRSVHEADCPPFTADTKIERRYTADHDYTRAGNFQPKVVLRHNSQTVATVSAHLMIRPGVSEEPQ